jgi:hypothetical protein
MSVINLIGQRFGKLTAISQSTNGKFGDARWNCICDCGKKIVTASHSLRRGNSKSCGCSRGYTDKSYSSKYNLFLKYKTTCAKKRGLSFTLIFEDFINISSKNCYYCGSSPNKFIKLRDGREGFYYNGLDRINNDKGYDLDNVRPCCTDCNYAKGTMTSDEFLTWVKKCHDYLKYQGKII